MSQCTVEECEKLYTSNDKWRVSLMAGVIFFIMSLPITYRLIEKLVGRVGLQVIDGSTPTLVGLIVMAVAFAIVSRIMML